MAVTVKYKPRTTGPLVPDIPKHGRPVILIECVPHINEEKSPSLLLEVLCLQKARSVYPPFNACFKSS